MWKSLYYSTNPDTNMLKTCSAHAIFTVDKIYMYKAAKNQGLTDIIKLAKLYFIIIDGLGQGILVLAKK